MSPRAMLSCSTGLQTPCRATDRTQTAALENPEQMAFENTPLCAVGSFLPELGAPPSLDPQYRVWLESFRHRGDRTIFAAKLRSALHFDEGSSQHPRSGLVVVSELDSAKSCREWSACSMYSPNSFSRR